MSGISAAEMSAMEQKNLMNVQSLVRRSENPNPITLIFTIVVIILVMGVMYVKFMKKSISGVWIDASDGEHVITHDIWRDVILVDGQYSGAINGHLVLVNTDGDVQTGLLMDDQIQWTDGSSWYSTYGM